MIRSSSNPLEAPRAPASYISYVGKTHIYALLPFHGLRFSAEAFKCLSRLVLPKPMQWLCTRCPVAASITRNWCQCFPCLLPFDAHDTLVCSMCRAEGWTRCAIAFCCGHRRQTCLLCNTALKNLPEADFFGPSSIGKSNIFEFVVKESGYWSFWTRQ